MYRLPSSLFRNNPKVRENYDHLMQVAAEKGVEASIREFRKLFGGDGNPTPEQEKELRERAAAKARWASPTSQKRVSRAVPVETALK